MRRRWISAVVAFALALGAPVPSAKAAGGFTDIDNHWARDVITGAVTAGYVKGYPDGTFKPDANVTRAEFLAIVTRASKLPAAGVEEPFVDVDARHWAVDAIGRGIGMGFISPSAFGSRFEPDKALTRAEMVTWLVNGLVKADPSFGDALKDTQNTILPFTEYFPGKFNKPDIPYIAVARGVGLVGGFPDGSFGPDRTTTRAEVVTLLTRYLAAEGTKAEDYKALNEMREVGLYGTNVKTIGNAEWYPGKGIRRPFYEAFNVELKPDRPIGTIILRKYILVDKELTSVYKDVFLSKEQQEELTTESLERFMRFVEVTLMPSKDLDTQSFLYGLPAVAGTTFQVRGELNQPKKYGFHAMTSDQALTMLKKGQTSTFWNLYGVMKSGIVVINTQDGKMIRMIVRGVEN
ncbi:S-layer homology domain-containing protein [Paenibacillus sp.]|uniref:S-layer homology domain-containing protein n=1 Tax=Paenibacillus sp. TaxID=58172 RepID=UPI002D4E0CF7|nr:S-layer homology domain-containing protein [Paenibacillus sp.]HZG87430.1 S-layer homology domain-containing protein [Paenibacillus sp.]